MYAPKRKTNTFPFAYIKVGLFALILAISAIGFSGTPVLADPETEESADALLVPTQQQRSWRNPFRGRTRRLRRIFSIQSGGGGGDGLPFLCNSAVLVPENVGYFAYYPNFPPHKPVVVLDHPADGAEIIVDQCGAININDIFLLDPSGQQLAPGTSGSKFFFDLPVDSPIGDYILRISTDSGSLEKTFEVPSTIRSFVPGTPFIRVYETNSGLQVQPSPLSPVELQQGQTLHVEYVGFDADTEVEAGMYYTSSNSLEWTGTLIDVWEFTTDSNGTFTEDIPIPSDAPVGRYHLVACAVNNCETKFNTLAVTREEYLIPPRIAWGGFWLGEPEESDAEAEATDNSYTVQPGDTLSQIARDNNTTVEELIDLNNIKNRHRIRVGLTLRLP